MEILSRAIQGLMIGLGVVSLLLMLSFLVSVGVFLFTYLVLPTIVIAFIYMVITVGAPDKPKTKE